MTNRNRIAAIGAAGVGMAAVMLGGVSAQAATPASAQARAVVVRPADSGCGYYGYQQYNHCGPTTVMLTVEHFFGADDHYCVSPGDNYINAGNDPNNSWVTTYAYYAGGPINCFPGWYS